MPSALVTALTAPIRDVAAMVGPGWAAGSADPAPALAGVRDALADVATATGMAWAHTEEQWRGAGAQRAAEFAGSAAAVADELAQRADELSRNAGAAGAAVAAASARLQAIVTRFEARAAALEPHLDDPGIAEQLLAEARHALTDAIAVVDELTAELDDRTAAVTTPAGFSVTPLPSLGSGFGAPTGSGLGGLGSLGGPAAMGGLGAGLAARSARSPETTGPRRPPAEAFGDGVAVRLPDGSTAMAPNAVAAGAVRYALTQLGVPYVWGGTTPGVGLDCSGLTQWAYGQAGLDIPRLAADQDVGAAVDAGALRPGDLAVWEGHVAMVVGDGLMVEAGDPVQLSAVRTSNAGQGFHGFFRPTA